MLTAINNPSIPADSSVAAEKLSDTVADEVLVLTGAYIGRENGTGWIRFQTHDIQGNAIVASLLTWFSTTEYGSAEVADRFDLPGEEIGENIATLTANSVLRVQTYKGGIDEAAKGYADLEIAHSPDGTYYVMGSINGRVISVEVVISGNE